MGVKDGYDTEWTKKVNPQRDKSGSLFKSILRYGDDDPQRPWGTADNPKVNRPSANAAIDKAVGPTRTGDKQALISRRALGMEAAPGEKSKSAEAKPKSPTPNRPVPKSSRPPGSASDREMGPGPARQASASAPASKPAAPAAKQSWWDKFGSDHKLSADKSYADYKKLMGD